MKRKKRKKKELPVDKLVTLLTAIVSLVTAVVNLIIVLSR